VVAAEDKFDRGGYPVQDESWNGQGQLRVWKHGGGLKENQGNGQQKQA